MKRKYAGLIIGFIVAVCVICAVWGMQQRGTDGNAAKARRTIMLYDCGADLETSAAMATYNIEQILNAHFSEDEGIRSSS